MKRCSGLGWVAAFALPLTLHAQGVLTVTPGRSTATVTGTGALGYTGDNGAAASAVLASPSAIAYDASGNLFLADMNNHVVREVLKATGAIVTVAGTGTAGFSGDGSAATSAQLDTPMGIAVDGSGTLYIADAHNNRIRRVTNGIISTVAGSGVAGFAGDGGQATAAQLALPSAIAIDSNGRLLIADTNNHRIRMVSGATITTVAGNGEELFAGDGGPAVAASLDSPSGVAVDTTGRIYIADRNNQRVRMVNTAGVISTLAGNVSGFSGAYGGDGASATAASLAKPTGVSVDAAGNVFIADTNNQRIRQVSGGAIATVAGSGDQGFGGDGGPASAAVLNVPKAAITDAAGNLLVADTSNQRVRAANLPALTFTSQSVGVPSTTQSITLSNTGTGALTALQVNVSGPFSLASGGSCTGLPVSLPSGASCTQNIAFQPTASGTATGSVTVVGSSVVPETVLLSGTAVQGTTTTTLTADNTAVLLNQPVVFTATVKPSGTGLASGTVSFFDGATQLGAAQTVTNDTASLTIATLGAGTHNVTAVYSGDQSYAGTRSAALTETIGDFSFLLSSAGSGGTVQTVTPGQAATYALAVQPVSGPFNFPVTLSAAGLPPGATVTFSPQTITVGGSTAGFSMTVHTATQTAASRGHSGLYGGGSAAFALLLLPFSSSLRRRARRVQPLAIALFLVGGGVVLTTLTGCGSANGFFGQPVKSYTVEIVGTATGAAGTTLQHVTNVQLTVE